MPDWKRSRPPEHARTAKRKWLQTEMAAYQQLREKISQRQAAASATPAPARAVPVEPAASAATAGDGSDVGPGGHGAQGVHPLGDESAAAANQNAP